MHECGYPYARDTEETWIDLGSRVYLMRNPDMFPDHAIGFCIYLKPPFSESGWVYLMERNRSKGVFEQVSHAELMSRSHHAEPFGYWLQQGLMHKPIARTVAVGMWSEAKSHGWVEWRKPWLSAVASGGNKE